MRENKCLYNARGILEDMRHILYYFLLHDLYTENLLSEEYESQYIKSGLRGLEDSIKKLTRKSELGLFSIFPPGINLTIMDMETEPINQSKSHIACFCNSIKKNHSNNNKYKSEGDWGKYSNNSK